MSESGRSYGLQVIRKSKLEKIKKKTKKTKIIEYDGSEFFVQ